MDTGRGVKSRQYGNAVGRQIASLWVKELNLQSRQKWSKPTRNTKIDDIVLIKDDNLPRGQWLIGKVVKLYTSQDHMIRSVKLLIGTSQLTEVGKHQSPVKYLDRPIHKLVLLLEAES